MGIIRRNSGWLIRVLAIFFTIANHCGTSRGLQTAQSVESLPSAVTHLPDFLPDSGKAEGNMRLLTAFEQASNTERTAAVPLLLSWADNPRPEVRSFALGLIFLDYIDSQPRNSKVPRFLPADNVRRIAPHLLDENGDVRNKAVLALSSAAYTDAGRNELQRVLVPLLRDGRVLRQFPDPLFIRSNEFILAHTPPQDRAAVQQMQQQEKVILLPAVGPQMLGLVLASALNKEAEAALITFINREDQTPSTLSDCLHAIALSRAPELLQNEAVTRVFEKNAMSVFLIQFLNNLSLTPEHLRLQRQRLMHLASDDSATVQTRHAASTVAACWGIDQHAACGPDEADFHAGDTASPEQIQQYKRMAEHD